MKSYSVFCNGTIVAGDVSHSEACQKFVESFNAGNKFKHVAMHEHTKAIKDNQPIITKTLIILEVTGRPLKPNQEDKHGHN